MDTIRFFDVFRSRGPGLRSDTKIAGCCYKSFYMSDETMRRDNPLAIVQPGG